MWQQKRLVVSNMFWSQYDDDLDGCCHFTVRPQVWLKCRWNLLTTGEVLPQPHLSSAQCQTPIGLHILPSYCTLGFLLPRMGTLWKQGRQEVDDGNIDGWNPNVSGDSQFPVDFPLNSSRQSIHWILVGEYPIFHGPKKLLVQSCWI